MEDSLTKDLFSAYEDFREKFAPQKEAFPDIAEFQKKMIGKGYLLYQTSDYLSSVIYLSIALWTYAIKPKSEESVNSLKKFIADARGRLKSSMAGDQKDDTPVYTYVLEKDMRDNLTGKPISFSTMSGANREKSLFRNKFIYPNLFPHLFLSDTNNILMYGLPGVGKTLIAKASVGELNRQANGEVKFLFYSLSGSDVRSKWEGGTEKNIVAMFNVASKQAKSEEEKLNKSSSSSSSSSSKRIKVKSVLFLDEVESLAQSREKGGDSRALTTLLQMMDGIKSGDNTIVMAATNIPWDLDSAFVRRFSSSIYIDLPDFLARVELLINTFIDKYLKHSDPRRLLSFVVIPNKPDSKEWESINSYTTNDMSKHILDYIDNMYNSLPEGKHSAKNHIEKYTAVTMNKIKGIVTSKPGVKVNWDRWMLSRFDHYRTFIKFIFYLSDQMGPSSKVLSKIFSGPVIKRGIPNSRTKYGYSASDITKIVSEFFSITAEQIIQSQFERKTLSTCDDEFIEGSSRKRNCYVKMISKSLIEPSEQHGMFTILSDAKMKEERFVIEKDGAYQDSYTVFIPELFSEAMDSYPSTTGNLDMYCNYIEYETTGATPNLKARCETIDRDGNERKMK